MLFENNVIECVYVLHSYIFETFEDLEAYLDTREYLTENKTSILANDVIVEEIDYQDLEIMIELGFRIWR